MAFLLMVILSGCLQTGSRSVSLHRYTEVAEVRSAVKSGPGKLESAASRLSDTRREFERFSKQKKSVWTKRGYMNAAENERMEILLYRFVSAQDGLSDMVGSLGGKHSDALFPEESLRTASHVLVTSAEFLMIHHRAEFVDLFADDPVAVAKLNEPFYRTEVPGKSYDRFRLSVTSPHVSSRLEASWDLFREESKERRISDLQSSDPGYSRLVKQMPADYQRAMSSLEKVREDTITASVTHSEAAALVRRARRDLDKSSYRARGLLFKHVGRIKNPATGVITFSEKQYAEVKRLLKPGDIVLTYTGGHLGDVFIPGRFKHGITYIGSPKQRKAAGLDVEKLPGAAGRGALELPPEFRRGKLDDGKDADVIESVAEGVIFNCLRHLMDTHVSRMVVLRPQFNVRERTEFIAEIISYYGAEYDFIFDFGDASRQVCTELIWRGINGRAGIDLPLTERGGHPTLSADDLVNYHFRTGGRHFEVVLFAEESGSGRRAVIHTGPGGEEKLRRQMEK